MADGMRELSRMLILFFILAYSGFHLVTSALWQPMPWSIINVAATVVCIGSCLWRRGWLSVLVLSISIAFIAFSGWASLQLCVANPSLCVGVAAPQLRAIKVAVWELSTNAAAYGTAMILLRYLSGTRAQAH